ncbi:hypothetical protein [Paenibacillus apiarius]|uniref:hypothetical protein n=1 Tax=Paenibacillus apiarius TaxID=46240 RepID=UPI003B3A5F11
MSESLKVLAVGDPAVYAYVDSRHRFLSRYEERNAAHLRMLEQHARPLPSLVQAGEVMGVLYQEIFEAFQGLRSAEAALQRAEARINAVQEGGG